MALARLCGACCGLLAFAGMTLRGLVAGNPVEMILWRAWIGLMVGVVLGMLLAHVGLKVVADNLPDDAADDAPAPIQSDAVKDVANPA